MVRKTAQDMAKTRSNERGAALLTVLFISTLMVAAGGALILLTSAATRNAVDSTAEMQAYYSAEAGVQSALNVLRGNVAPRTGMPVNSKISFRNAITYDSSNLPGDTSANYRLSGWLNYDYTPSGATNPDRVSLTPNYAPLTGLAYTLDITDPDNTPLGQEPTRLLLHVTGYGPKTAVKRLEILIKRSNVDYNPVATVLVGGSTGADNITFTIGQSNAKDYSGHDNSGSGVLPAFGATKDSDRAIEVGEDGKERIADPKTATITNSSLPSWLQTADQARHFLVDQKANAMEQGRYFSTFSGTSGSTANPAFTYVDGDCTLDGGAGLLIVTGTLTMNGNPNFSGLILVLGDGRVNRDGGGNGSIYGAMIVFKFPKTGNGGFQSSTFTTDGGGTSLMQYDSVAVRKALNVAGPKILGIHEY